MADKQKIEVNVQCKFNKEHSETIKVWPEDWAEWTTGTPRLIQSVFPYLPAGEREILISGMCTACWDTTFKNVEEY